VRVGILEGKTGLILGVANKRSVAWGCARALHREGMSLALTHANERLEGSVRELAAELGVETVLPCDVTRQEEIDALIARTSTPRGRASSSRRTSRPTRCRPSRARRSR
jgi:enoyl-[acyl-carrier protein] reductase I